MPLDYLYTQTKETWLQRKIQIGRRDEEFTVMLSSFFMSNFPTSILMHF